MTNDRYQYVQELVRQLRPFLGDKADQWLDHWIASDRQGRELAERELLWMQRKHFPNPDAVVLPPPALPKAEGLSLGTIMHDTTPAGEFVVPPEHLLKHALITGATGAGKTTLIFQIVKGLLIKDVPFFLFDFKLDYRPLLGLDPKVRLYTIGQALAPVGFNPLVELAKPLIQVKTVRDWAPVFQLSDVLCRVFYAGHGVRSLLNKAFVHVVQDWAQHDQDPDFTPTFQLALKWLRDYESAEKGMRVKEWKASTVRVLEALAMGEFGRQLNVASDHHTPYLELKKHPTVFELNLSEDLKNAFVETLLLCGRQASLEGLKEHERGTLNHVMIIDESHNLLREYPGLGESQLQLALREHRGLGCAYILSDQNPSQLDHTALGNTHLKFFFTLLDRTDINVASKTLLLERDQDVYLARLPTGTCIARTGNSAAFVLRVPPADDVMKNIVTDAQVRDASNQLSQLSSPESSVHDRNGRFEGSDRNTLGEAGKLLLADILTEPFAGLTKHFDNILMSSRNGSELKAKLEVMGLVREHQIPQPTGGSHKTVLELTKPGVELLQELGFECHYPYFGNGAEHEHTKEFVAQHFQARGYKVTKEYQVPGDGIIDVVAERDGERIAVEVETGKSDIEANLDKLDHANATTAIAVPTNAHARERLEALQPDHPTIQVQTTEDLASHVTLGDFFTLPGPEKLYLLTAAERPDPFNELPPAPATYPNYWRDAITKLKTKGLLTSDEQLTDRAWKLVGLMGFLEADRKRASEPNQAQTAEQE